jgi:hypothetical protein
MWKILLEVRSTRTVVLEKKKERGYFIVLVLCVLLAFSSEIRNDRSCLIFGRSRWNGESTECSFAKSSTTYFIICQRVSQKLKTWIFFGLLNCENVHANWSVFFLISLNANWKEYMRVNSRGRKWRMNYSSQKIVRGKSFYEIRQWLRGGNMATIFEQTQ